MNKTTRTVSTYEKCTVELPEKFDADKLLENVQGRADRKSGLKDAMYFILHSLIQQMKTREGKDLLDRDGLVYLHSDILGDICGKRYTEAFELLQEAEVIYRSDSYSPGFRSKGVCLLGDYAASEYKHRELSDGLTKRKVLKHRKEQEEKNAAELAKIPYIVKWFNEKLQIDLESAHSFTELHSFKLKQAHIKSVIHSTDVSNRINTRYNSSRISVDKIAEGNFGLKKTGRDNRLHSSVSSIKKELRSFLTYDHQPLISIDVKSSQPYLLTQLLKPEFYTNGNNGLNIQAIYPELAKVLPKEDIKDILMSVGYGLSFDDVKWEDDFYTEFMKLHAEKHPVKKPYFKDRADVKHKMMILLYDKKPKGEAFKKFEGLFPKEAALVSLIHKISKKDENFLPILLQRLESKLMLELVGKEIAGRLPTAPIIPVHDSIMTTPTYVEQVKKIMEEVLTHYTGIKPGLKVEAETAEYRLDNLNTTVADDFKDMEEKIIKNKYKADAHVNAKAPALKEIPRHKGDQVLSTRYIDENKPNYHDEMDRAEHSDEASSINPF